LDGAAAAAAMAFSTAVMASMTALAVWMRDVRNGPVD
jgi:hypothetical protein